MADTEVVHDAAQSQFLITVDGTRAGFADYSRTDDVLDFNHTVTEPAFQGRGLATELIRTALDEVRSDGLQIRASCSFVAAFVREHKEYADLLAPGR